jgi:Fe-S-cluster containining protein
MRVRRFACIQCGKCCNRSPEVELSEAAPLADVFAFRLMFRLYTLPRAAPDYVRADGTRIASEIFFQRKRLLRAFAVRTTDTKSRRGDRAVPCTQYLILSALTVDCRSGACSALADGRCSIYGQRPLTCRTVPFNYARPEALAERDLDAFLEAHDHRCDTGEAAPIVLKDGKIVDRGTIEARQQALSLVERDRRWGEAIVRAMKLKQSDGISLPTLSEIEANAPRSAMTTSMRVAWQIAADSGLITAQQCQALIAAQLNVIDRELARGECSSEARETLAEMRAEYRHALDIPAAIAMPAL